MTFRRLFPNTAPPATHADARARVRALLREWLREAPRAARKYPLATPVAHVRARIRAHFDANAHVRSLPAVHALVVEGTMALIEVHNKWTQRTHVVEMLDGHAEQVRRLQEACPPLAPGGGALSFPRASPFLARFLSPAK